MHIKHAHFELWPLDEDVDFDKWVNLFIGPNASGKSSILRAMEGFYSLAVTRGRPFGVDDMLGYPNSLALLSPSDDWPRDGSDLDGDWKWVRWDKVPLLYIPATRVNLPGIHIFNDTIDRSASVRSDHPLEALFDTSSGIFNGQYAEQAIDWLRRPHYLRDGNSSTPEEGFERRQEPLRKALQIGYSCAKAICREVISGTAPRNYIELDDGREITPTGRVVHYGMGIARSDDILSEPLYAGALSSGTQGTLLWIWALALKVAYHYDWEEGWEEKPAILLIDEIENHLHPTWQRRVIPALLKHFPKLQIFATTHSPFVVAGLKAGQVHLLKRGEHGSVTASTNTEDVIGWTADEILRTMMGVDEPTDQLTVDRVNRLRELREKDTLTSKEESELNGLRRQINKDLLAKGGPLEVEREHYADLMQEFLRNRQSELTQDTE